MMDVVKQNLHYIIPAGIAVVLYVAWEIVNGARSRRSRRGTRPAHVPKQEQARWWQFRRKRLERARPKDEDEFHADAAALMTRRLEEQAREAQIRHEQRVAEVARTVDKARRLVEQSGIGTAAVDLLATMWNWPVEARERNWSRPAGLHELEYRPPDDAEDAETADDGDVIKVLRWLWDGSPYRMTLSRAEAGAGDEASSDGRLSLEIEDETVLEIDVRNPGQDQQGHKWSVEDVAALQAGQWMVEFAAFAGRLKMAEEEKQRQLEFERQSARAARIDLGEFDEDEQEEDGESARKA